MTASWPPRPPDRIRHGCLRRGPVVETLRPDPDGRPVVVELCLECEQTDLLERVRDARST